MCFNVFLGNESTTNQNSVSYKQKLTSSDENKHRQLKINENV